VNFKKRRRTFQKGNERSRKDRGDFTKRIDTAAAGKSFSGGHKTKKKGRSWQGTKYGLFGKEEGKAEMGVPGNERQRNLLPQRNPIMIAISEEGEGFGSGRRRKSQIFSKKAV